MSVCKRKIEEREREIESERVRERERERGRERVNPVKSRCMMTEISKEIMKQLQRKTKIFRDSKFV